MTLREHLLVFGATGQTGQHFTRFALDAGHRVRAVARTPSKLAVQHDDLQVVQGSVPDDLDLDALLDGVTGVVVMLGDAAAQRERPVNTQFVRTLVPAMRRVPLPASGSPPCSASSGRRSRGTTAASTRTTSR